MANYAIIRAGKVVNVIVKDALDPWPVPGEVAVVVPDGIGIGDDYNGTTFIPKAQTIPALPRTRVDALEESLIKKGILAKADIDTEASKPK